METSIIAVAAVAAVQNIIDKQVMPALAKLASSVKRDFKLKVEPLGHHFSQYLKRTYEKNSILNTLVFHNQQKRLKDLYIPLTLVQEGVGGKKKPKGVRIEGFPQDLVSKYHRVLITDTAGMGKSTLTKVMFLSAIDQEVGIPFYVELRKLSTKHLLIDEIRDQLGSLTEEFDDYLMRAFFQSGGFIFFFDGYDEVMLSERIAVTEDIKNFIEKAPDNYYIMTSRYEQSLAGFGDFQSMKINPLTKKEAFDLLRRYDSNGETSERLIDKLEAGDYDKIQVFLQNPLLVSLLFIGFEFKPEIPLKIHLFYDQVFEAYYNNHDLSKDGYYTREKESGLDMADFAKYLRAIGYICLTKHQLEFTRDDFLEIIEKAGKLSCIQMLSPLALMNDLLHAVPLFCQDGINYKWVHKSMQEYFAADFINRDCGAKKESLLEALANSADIMNYMNLIELYADIDNKSFLKFLVLPVLEDFIAFVESPVSSSNPEIVSMIRCRRQILYNRDMYFYLFTAAENKMPIAEGFSILRGLVKSGPIVSSISHISGARSYGVVYVSGRRDGMSRLIAKKYPETRLRLDHVSYDSVFALESGRAYHVTEDFLLDNQVAYRELNSILSSVYSASLDYESVKVLRENVKQTIKDNEDIFQGLLSF